MKKLFVFSILLTFALFTNTNFCQKFMKYQTWATEKYRDPGNKDSRILDYTLTNFLLKGNWNGALDESNIPIKSLGIINHTSAGIVNIYTIETRGYRVLDPLNQYDQADVVNAQEGLTLESTTKTTPTPACDAYTKHPTIQRWVDNTNPAKFPVPSDIKYAVSGNFLGDGKSEIMLFYKLEKSNKRNN